MNDIDVEQIMSEIRSEIKAKGYKASDLKFKNPENFDRDSLSRTLSEAGAKWQVDLYPTVSGGALKRLVKKTIRKLVRPSFHGTMRKQEDFNRNAVSTLSEMNKWMRELEGRMAELEKKIERNEK